MKTPCGSARSALTCLKNLGSAEQIIIVSKFGSLKRTSFPPAAQSHNAKAGLPQPRHRSHFTLIQRPFSRLMTRPLISTAGPSKPISIRPLAFIWIMISLGSMIPLAQANEPADWRIWKSTAGTELDARLISQNETAVTLEKRSGARITVQVNQLSNEDQEYLKSIPTPEAAPDPTPVETPVEDGIGSTPGQVSDAIPCKADTQWNYYLYLPKDYTSNRKWPVCFVMDPSGGSAETLGRYLPAADHLGMVLAASKESKNEFAESPDAMLAMVKDVYSSIAVNQQLVIASGMSGGCRMAYRLAELAPPIAGILACGAGDGVYTSTDINSYRPAKIPRGTIICSLIGTNDYNRTEAMRSYRTYRKDSRLIWFPGNHEWAPSELIVEGMSHVLGEVLRTSKSKELEPLRSEFAERRLSMVQAELESAPWTAHRWAAYLAKYPAGTKNQLAAQSLAGRLAGDARVKLAAKAESEIEDLSNKFFPKALNSQDDKAPNPAREREAQKQAAQFESLPHAEILRRLGLPASD